jgi:hypothetical protein
MLNTGRWVCKQADFVLWALKLGSEIRLFASFWLNTHGTTGVILQLVSDMCVKQPKVGSFDWLMFLVLLLDSG